VRFLSRIAFSSSCLLLLILGLAWLVVKGPWTIGIWTVEREIAANPNVCQRLDVYSLGGQELADTLSWTHIAQPVVGAIKVLKDLGVWDSFLDVLEGLRPGLRLPAQTLDRLTAALVRVPQELARLNQLSETAQGCRAFLTAPNKRILRLFSDSAGQSTPPMLAVPFVNPRC
jgi:hypothetical protein